MLASYQRAFPADDAWVLKGRADLAMHRGAASDALAVYDRAFNTVFCCRNRLRILRPARAHAQPPRVSRLGARRHRRAPGRFLPPSPGCSTTISGRETSAPPNNPLADFEARREDAARTADELFTLAGLYQRTRNDNEALRYYSAIHTLPWAPAPPTSSGRWPASSAPCSPRPSSRCGSAAAIPRSIATSRRSTAIRGF